MKSILIITLFVASAIAVPAKSHFPRPGYYSAGEVAVEKIDRSSIQIPFELQRYINKEISPVKDMYGDIYIPMPDPPAVVIRKLKKKLLTSLLYRPISVSPNGFRLYLVESNEFNGITRYLYATKDFQIYVKI